MMHIERSVEVDADYLIPEHDTAIEEVHRFIPPRDVCQQIDRPGRGLKAAHRFTHLIVVSNIDCVSTCLVRSLRAKADGLLRAAVVQVKDSDDAAFFGQTDCRSTADA